MGHIDVGDLAYALPGGRVLFEGVDLRVGSGHHVALVGANGVGKTTLLRVIAGQEKPLRGHVRVGGRTGYMPQFVGSLKEGMTVGDLLLSFSHGAIRDAARCLDAAEAALSENGGNEANLRYAHALAAWGEVGGYEAEVLWDVCTQAALALPFVEVADRPADTLSGGEQKRLVLEMLFRSDHEVLLLDEPDNYLDLEGKRWLEDRLSASRQTILYVSHDRALLAATSDKVATIEASGAWVHHGSFATYHEARAARIDGIDEERRRFREERDRLYASMREFKRRAALSPKFAGRAKAAETRLHRFEREKAPRERPTEQRVRMELGGGRTGKIVMKARGLSVPGIFGGLTTELRYGERIGVVGPNGVGKSHFLRLLASPDVEHTGSWSLGARVVAGFFSQTNELPGRAGETPLGTLLRGGLERGAAMSALKRYELAPAAETPVEKLSGGQAARLQILLLEVGDPTLLLLDEPTDNLDVDSAEALEKGLSAYEGTVLAVTHDRWFMRLMDRFLVFSSDGTVREALEAPEVGETLPA